MASNVPNLNYYLYITIHLHLVTFHATKCLSKNLLGEMPIEQITEFESRVPGPLVVHIFLKLVIFMTKQKSSKANLRVHYLMLTWAKSQNLTPKCKILNVFWT